MLGEPLANLWMLVSGIVVDDRAESFFAKLTNRRLKRGVFRSVDDLKDAINCRIVAPAAFPGSASTDAYWRPSAEGGR